MVRTGKIAAALLLGTLSVPAFGDDVSYVEENGIQYQVTRQVVQRQIPETRYEPREYTAYRERYTTDMQDVQRTYQVPVTEQQWMPGYQRTWNLLAPPVLSYRLVPVTRWETRTETVRTPSTRRELIPERQTQHVPVTTNRLVQDEHVHRVAVGLKPGSSTSASSVAARPDSSADRPNEAPRDDSTDQISRRR